MYTGLNSFHEGMLTIKLNHKIVNLKYLDVLDGVKRCAVYINSLEQDCSNSSALAMELLQFCTKSLIYSVTFAFMIIWPINIVLSWHCVSTDNPVAAKTLVHSVGMVSMFALGPAIAMTVWDLLAAGIPNIVLI